MQFLLGFAFGATMVALLALQYLKGYREGIRCAARTSIEEALKSINLMR